MCDSYQIANYMQKYEFVEHTADVAFRAYGADARELFEHAAEALESIMICLDDVSCEDRRTITLTAETCEDLLYDWLSELLVLFEVDAFAVRRCSVDIEGLSLRAECLGTRIDPGKHRLKDEVKAVTYHELEVKKNAYFQAQVTLDV